MKTYRLRDTVWEKKEELLSKFKAISRHRLRKAIVPTCIYTVTPASGAPASKGAHRK